MRYVDNSQFVKKYGAKDKNDGEYWKNKLLKNDIKDLCNGKCWYTETLVIGSDIHVDHFRPKKRVTQYLKYDYNCEIKNSGYDWLKNDSSNYRAACAYANRGKGTGTGKHDFFPLKHGSYHAKGGDDWKKETPLLIDPCNKDDVKLITFVGGQARCIDDKNSYAIQRFMVSEKLYNLNHQEFIKHRQQIWDETKKIIEKYEQSLKTEYDKKICLDRLSEKVDRKNPFSACAIACVLSLASQELCDQLNLEL